VITSSGYNKAKLLYHQFLYDIECRKPSQETGSLKSFYKREIKSISRYHEVNFAFYQYYRCGADHLDQLYFVRGKERLYLHPFSASVDFDADFNTSHDHKAARILANDMLLRTIEMLLARVGKPNSPSAAKEEKAEHLSWTQTKAGLIELIYSLHETKAIDNGNITLKRLAREFEKIFNISLGNFYDTFDWIACRPKPTTYLDELKDALLVKIDKKMK
jgi:hypothetical protein